MWGAILSAILGKNPLSAISDTVKSVVDNETQRQAIIADAVKTYMQHDAEIRLAAMQSRTFWMIWALFAAPLGIWWTVVVADTIFQFTWSVPNLPASIQPWAGQIFGSIFGSGAVLGSAQAIGSAIRGRR